MRLRTFVMWAIMGLIPAAFALAAVASYYAYAKLTYPGFFCGSFARLDGELGWVLAPNASSCIGARAPFSSGPPWFEAAVHTDRNGFRAPAPGGDSATDGVLFIGDSWTFGYGVTFDQSFPGRVQQRSALPAVIAASPAYGAAQAIALGERWVGRLRPRAIVYFDIGLWDRSACQGRTRPSLILKPCYWQPSGEGAAELVFPKPGLVERAAAWGVQPGGMLGAGEKTWTYFLVSRPAARVMSLMVRAGLMSGYGHDFAAVGVDATAIIGAALRHAAHLADKSGAPLLLIDPADRYGPLMASLGERANVRLVGSEQWTAEVATPAARLPAEQREVPQDGHFGPGTNDLVAALIIRELQAIGIVADAPAR
jgi:hypothetical protein